VLKINPHISPSKYVLFKNPIIRPYVSAYRRGGPDADLALKKGPKVDVRATQFTQQIKRTPLLVYYKTARKKIFWANLLIY